MAQGTRGKWMRVAAAGFGVLLSTSLVGCMNWDKSKDTKLGTKQPTPGLPGTPKLDSAGNPMLAKAGQPTTPFNGANLQPNNGLTATGVGQPRYGTNGLNTNNTGSLQPIDYRAQPGNPGSINAPLQPGVTQTGGPIGSATPPQPSWNAGAGAPGSVAFSPPPPPLTDMPLPPAPPLHGSPGAGDLGNGASVQPPVAPVPPGPIPPGPTPPVSPAGGKTW